ncbi:serine-threonine protein kinase 19, partial [Trichophaea hybrida]
NTVLQAISHIRTHLFSPLPENFKGLSPTKVSEILQFRARIPPYVPIPLINALLAAPTSTAKEIAELCASGELRKLHVSSRERKDEGGVVPTEYLYRLVRESELNQELKEKFINTLKANATSAELPGHLFEKAEVRELMDAGFLTLPSSFRYDSAMEEVGKSTLTSMCSVAVSGTAAAVGGRGVVTKIGYSSRMPAAVVVEPAEYAVSLPTLGPLLAVLRSARRVFLEMLRKGRNGGETEKVLRERWDGGATAGRCRKWRELKGLHWEGVVGECLGRGECELFEVVGIGLGVR